MSLLFDTHVHYHPAVISLGQVLDAAVRNLGRLAERTTPPEDGWRFGFCLFELQDQDAVARLGPGPAGHWQLHLASDPTALLAERPDDASELTILRGQQWVTSEGLEVLSLGRRLPWVPKQPAAELVARLLGEYPVLVMPWGAGKWLGRREGIVRALAEAYPDRILLGDNGGRPTSWPRVSLLERQRVLGSGVPVGTDPLPVPGDGHRVGSYATRLDGIEADANLFKAILDHPASATTMGERVNTWQFVSRQLQLRLKR